MLQWLPRLLLLWPWCNDRTTHRPDSTAQCWEEEIERKRSMLKEAAQHWPLSCWALQQRSDRKPCSALCRDNKVQFWHATPRWESSYKNCWLEHFRWCNSSASFSLDTSSATQKTSNLLCVSNVLLCECVTGMAWRKRMWVHHCSPHSNKSTATEFRILY